MEFPENLSAQKNSAAPWHPWSEITGDPWAVVACVDSLNGIQTVRELSRQGVRIIGLVSNPDDPFGRTRLCEKVAVATTEGPELIETLLELGVQLGQKAVLFPVSDDTVGMISRHRKSLSEYFHIVLPSEDVVEMMLSKDKFYAHAVAEDLPVPRTVVVSDPSDLETAIETLTFPCIVKPERRAEIWHKFTKYKGLKIADVAELRQLYEACHKMVGTIIVQEWIVGTSADLYSCNLYLDAKSEPLATFVARKLRQWPPDVGSSSSGEECRNDAVLELAIDFFKSAGCHGLGYLEVKRDARSGRHVIIEPNIGRPTGRSPIAEAGGVELVYTMYCDALGRPLPAGREQKYSGVKWIYLRWDLQSAFIHWRRGDLTIADWYRSIRGKKAYALFSLTDPGPFLWDLWSTFVKVGPELWTRIRGGSTLGEKE